MRYQERCAKFRAITDGTVGRPIDWGGREQAHLGVVGRESWVEDCVAHFLSLPIEEPYAIDAAVAANSAHALDTSHANVTRATTWARCVRNCGQHG